MLSAEYDPCTWTPEEAPEFVRSEVGQVLTPIFHSVRRLTQEEYGHLEYKEAVRSLAQLNRPGQLLTPEEEFFASRMAYVARHSVERWANRRID